MALTDISGIGAKTAEKLRNKGITSKSQLLQAFKDQDRRVVGSPTEDGLNTRALEGIRQELTATGESFVDPIYGIPTTPENEQARQMFDKEFGTDVAKGFGDFTRDKPRVDSGMNVLEGAAKALRGDAGTLFGTESYEDVKTKKYGYGDSDMTKTVGLEEADDADRATKEAFEWSLDAAANLSPFNRETIEKGNRLSGQTAGMEGFTVRQTTTVERETSQGTIEAEDNMQIDAREYARARKFQQERSLEAKRVDNQRKAPVTDEITTWKDDPAHWDYPGMDTPGGRQDIVTEDSQQQAKSIDETVRGADEEVTEIAFGNPLDEMF